MGLALIVLALETATSACSVALYSEGRVTAHASLDRPRAHAEHLVPMVADVLRYGGVKPADVTAVAVSSGPGSYTGLRIGVSTAKGLAAAWSAELVAVPSLLALADLVRPFTVENDRIAAAFDARRDEAYAASFLVEHGELHPVREATTVGMGDVREWLAAGRSESTPGGLFLVGEGWVKMREHLDGIPARRISLGPSAVSVARLGAGRLSGGQVEDIVTFEPYYLKDFVATKPRQTAFEKLSF